MMAMADTAAKAETAAAAPIPAADQVSMYLNYLKGKNVGMLINQTSVIGSRKVPVVDSLLRLGITVRKIYGPEHGVRGNAANGATIDNSIDPVTKLPVISLYGKHFKPTPADLKGINLMVFDVQDVGTRFYTYISTLHYVMEACAENNIELVVLDRPNPNGYFVDGPILDTAFRSFVGMHPIPVVHGMTIAEYAQMINGEGWLKGAIKCKLKLFKVANYTHATPYVLPVNPSPNLNSAQSILLYPHICFFEGTNLSLGRGTPDPFQVVGSPLLKGKYSYSFKPVSIPGVSDNPPLKDQVCYGISLKDYNTDTLRKTGRLNLAWLIKFYKDYPDKEHFFIPYIERLAGSKKLKEQIIAGKTEAEIRQSWEPGLSQFKATRAKYLLYK
ncbi:DUF1343 domain-containing protein [Mucilaginibacter terrenus]|uniref:DUF1343 domain-containing protein n=2 Tax=Mucilaginibacter terrenus TaxID=2482727 RepID=A0A3E2NYZ8_9SPHI|nr:DUF1343 domain-containing protein [Mucilaginibacter terrenus]